MIEKLNKAVLAVALFAAGAVLMVAPAVLGAHSLAAGQISSATIAVAMMLSAVGLGYGSLDFWSRFAVGLGAWSLIAPVVFDFYQSSVPFWSHMLAGFVSLLVGVGGHELMQRRVRAGDTTEEPSPESGGTAPTG